MPYSVIPTKLYAPSPRAGVVARERLSLRLQKALQRRLTLVSAPAGFGKTTVISQMVADSDSPVAWLSLDEADAEPLRFIAGVTAAINSALPGSVDATLALLGAGQQGSGQPSIDAALPILLKDLTSLHQHVIVVLDDYHRLDNDASSGATDDAFSFLLEHLPATIQWVITTREDPSLPLARMRVNGDLAELRADDLRFTAQEAAEFFRQTMGIELDDTQVAALEAKTEGWIAGLQLAALSMQSLADAADRESFINSFAGSHRFVIDYLAEEVLNAQPEEMQEFLLKTSILPRFNAPLCERVTGVHKSASILRQLEALNLFLISLDEERQWYRYHHLFADVLKARLKNSSISTTLLHTQASGWFAEQQLFHEAIEHALQGENFEKAAEIIAACWPELRKSEPEAIFIQWIKSLPEDIAINHPVLATYYSLAVLSYDPEQAQRWMQSASKAVDKAGSPAKLTGILAICQAYAAGATGNLTSIIAHADEALALLPESELTWRGAAAILKGFVLWGSGDIEAAALSTQAGIDAMRRDNEISGAISSIFLLAKMRIMQGQADEAERLCERALKLIEPYPLAPQGGCDIYVVRALLALRRGDHELTNKYLGDAQALGEQSRLMESAHQWYLVKAILEARNNNTRDALDLIDEAESIRIPNPAPEFEPIDAWRARIDLLSGNLASAEAWAKRSGMSLADEPHVMTAFSLITLVHIELTAAALNKDSSALSEVLALLKRFATLEENNRPGMMPEILLLTGYCLHLMNDENAAIRTLDAALSSPAAEQNAAVFMTDIPVASTWIKNSLRKINAPSWLVFPDTSTTHPTANIKARTQSLTEPLSERELEVLKAFNSDMSGPEIAASLFISLNTFRTHCKNIYSKLDVNTRRAAIRRAEELCLI